MPFNCLRNCRCGFSLEANFIVFKVNNSERGFSVLADGPLDMRMDPQVRDEN